MAIYSIKKIHGLALLIGVVLSTTNRGEYISQKKEHNHGPDINQVNACRVPKPVKKNSRTSQLSTQRIVALNVTGINQSTASALSALPSMTRLCQRTRRDAKTVLTNPNSLALIVLPIESKPCHRGENFYDVIVTQMKIEY
ncbi:hypothetical protein RF11_12068 [Thelohanellus kitauei]|uniref:Uncharacterized protein n=1 Tax=Thelohanellus kitauei TaxID=669202 RepID=A0A0C2JHK3_THEKT|nr:hypothetical protein RF11_12068 [Thelohanellus kitauei]